ncbi:MAG: hypothetical protein H7Y11_08115 [Armatimonadetes bacterium]|nr:hypothetical protein [Anaerolineae bacterium]
MADKTTTTLQLTVEQFGYLQARHEQVERAVIAAKTGDNTLLQALWQDEGYQRFFKGMDWDDVYDRYQDTHGYDDTLSHLLHKALQEALNSRSINPPIASKSTGKVHLTSEHAAQLGLRKLHE